MVFTVGALFPISLSRSTPVLGWFVPTLYRLSMQMGLRALWNRMRALRLGRPKCAAALQGATMHLPGLGPMRLTVHGRPTPKGESPTRLFAIISARQIDRRQNRLAYRYLLATSHFGCGHLELGCFEEHGRLTLFGIRNMALANAVRFGFGGLQIQGLGTSEESTTEFARACLAALTTRNIRATCASPSESVRLSVRSDLIPPADRIRVQRILTARYKRLHSALHHRSS